MNGGREPEETNKHQVNLATKNNAPSRKPYNFMMWIKK